MVMGFMVYKIFKKTLLISFKKNCNPTYTTYFAYLEPETRCAFITGNELVVHPRRILQCAM